MGKGSETGSFAPSIIYRGRESETGSFEPFILRIRRIENGNFIGTI